MTTYTLTGLAVYRNPVPDTVAGVENNVTLELVVPESTTSLSYTVNPLPPGDGPGDETVEVSLDEYTVRLNGMPVGENGPGDSTDSKDSIFEVVWLDAGNVSRTSTVFVSSAEAVSVPGLGTVDADYIFVLDGAPLPAITTVAQWNAFEGSISGIGVPTGTYGPGADIPLTILGATISEDDLITGTAGKDVFRAGIGDDVIDGKGGNDRLFGEDGADRLDGGRGNDRLVGGKGNDRLVGRDGTDTALGGAGKDKLFGGKGDDLLQGEKGKDRLEGGDGKDRLDGGSGNDRLLGGKGNDRLDGGAGNDRMTGGGGNDTFIFSNGADVVTDFNAANNKEKIDLSDVAAITSFNDLKNNHATQNGANLVIDDAAGNTLTLNGLAIGDLNAGDFIF